MDDLISRQAAIRLAIDLDYESRGILKESKCREIENRYNMIPSAQPNIKQAAKLLSDFIESCPGGVSYLITPDGEELRTDWGYAIEGIQLIYDWAERREETEDDKNRMDK